MAAESSRPRRQGGAPSLELLLFLDPSACERLTEADRDKHLLNVALAQEIDERLAVADAPSIERIEDILDDLDTPVTIFAYLAARLFDRENPEGLPRSMLEARADLAERLIRNLLPYDRTNAGARVSIDIILRAAIRYAFYTNFSAPLVIDLFTQGSLHELRRPFLASQALQSLRIQDQLVVLKSLSRDIYFLSLDASAKSEILKPFYSRLLSFQLEPEIWVIAAAGLAAALMQSPALAASQLGSLLRVVYARSGEVLVDASPARVDFFRQFSSAFNDVSTHTELAKVRRKLKNPMGGHDSIFILHGEAQEILDALPKVPSE